MIFKKKNGKDLPSHITEMAEVARKSGDGVTRREFLALASIFGASTATAYSCSVWLYLPRLMLQPMRNSKAAPCASRLKCAP